MLITPASNSKYQDKRYFTKNRVKKESSIITPINTKKKGTTTLKHFLFFTGADIILSALTYSITALGCLGWGKKWWPHKENFIEKHGREISSGINTGINIGRVFLGQSVTPLSLGLASVTPFIGNRLYRWADKDNENRFTIADRTVHGIAVVAKASKRFSSWDDAKVALLEAFFSRAGRDATKPKLFEFLGTSRDPETNAAHIKTIGSKLVNKYTWNFLCFGLLDWIIKLFCGNQNKEGETKS